MYVSLLILLDQVHFYGQLIAPILDFVWPPAPMGFKATLVLSPAVLLACTWVILSLTNTPAFSISKVLLYFAYTFIQEDIWK